MRCAPVPRPGKFLGQVVTIFQLKVSEEIAGEARAVVARVAPAAALLTKLLLFMALDFNMRFPYALMASLGIVACKVSRAKTRKIEGLIRCFLGDYSQTILIQ